MKPNKGHFSEEELRLFLFKEHSVSLQKTISSHLKECPACKKKLDCLFVGFLMSRRSEEEQLSSMDKDAGGEVTVLSADAEDRMFGKNIVTLGSGKDCDFPLPGKAGDNSRCSIIRKGTEYYLTETGSGGGITLNGQEVSLGRLSSGDKIGVSGHEVVFSTLDQPPPGGGFWLLGVDGRKYEPDSRQPCLIGKAAGNQILISDDVFVSKHHAEIRLVKGKWVIRDLGSKNGTFVNGKRTEKRLLSSGDRITIGKTSLRFNLK